MSRRSKTTPGKLKAAERRQLAWDMRVSGKSGPEIARELGVTRQSVNHSLHKVLNELNAKSQEYAETYREITNSRYDKLIDAIWEKARGGHLAAIDRIVQIENSRHSILGTKAPRKLEVGIEGALTVTAEHARERLKGLIEKAAEAVSHDDTQ